MSEVDDPFDPFAEQPAPKEGESGSGEPAPDRPQDPFAPAEGPEGNDPFAALDYDPFEHLPASPPPQELAPPAPQPPRATSIFTPVRWLLLLSTLLALIPLWASQRSGLEQGYESPLGLRPSSDWEEQIIAALNGNFGYSEWTGALLVIATLIGMGGRVERSWGSGVLAAAFLLGGAWLNLLRLNFEAGDPSLIAISGGWTGAAVVLGLGAATPAGWHAWLVTFGLLILVGVEGESGAAIVVALCGLVAGYLTGRALKPSYSAAPTVRGCVLLLFTVGVLGLVELTALVRNVDVSTFESWIAGRSRTPEPESLGPLSDQNAAHLGLTLGVPEAWSRLPMTSKHWVMFTSDEGRFVSVARFKEHPFNRDPDTFLLRYVLAEQGADDNRYGSGHVLQEGTFSGKLGRGYRIVLRCGYRSSDRAVPGYRCSYAFRHGEEVVWIDGFLPEQNLDDPESFAQQLFDSIASSVRLTDEEGPK